LPNHNGHRDALVLAPPAQMFARNPLNQEIAALIEPPSPEEIIQAQSVEIRRLASDLEKLRVTMHTIANVTVALVYMLGDERDGGRIDEIRVPRDLRNKLEGCAVEIRSEEEDIIVRNVSRARGPVWNGRPDG